MSSSFWLILAPERKIIRSGGVVIGANRACARVNQGRRPNSLPSCTACVLRFAPSLSKTRLEWVFTVLSLTKSFSAISRLLRPWAISSRISNSRRVIWRSSRFLSSGMNGPLGRDGDLPHNNCLAFRCQLEAKPDAKNGKGRGDQSAVDFDGMFDDQELILGPLEQSNQDSTDQPVHEDVALHKLQEDSLPKLSHPWWGRSYCLQGKINA